MATPLQGLIFFSPRNTLTAIVARNTSDLKLLLSNVCKVAVSYYVLLYIVNDNPYRNTTPNCLCALICNATDAAAIYKSLLIAAVIDL